MTGKSPCACWPYQPPNHRLVLARSAESRGCQTEQMDCGRGPCSVLSELGVGIWRKERIEVLVSQFSPG
jgi:hypothetical protein